MFTFTEDDIKILQHYGFVREEAVELDEDEEYDQEIDDEYGVSYDLCIKNHAFLDRIRISVNHNINVRCDENEFGQFGGDSVLIIRQKFTHENLRAILSFLGINEENRPIEIKHA